MNDQKDYQTHWERVYQGAEISKLGWYEESPEPSLELIRACALPKDAVILNVGAGATTLVDALIEQGYERIIANDISSIALEKLEQRLGDAKNKVDFVVDDLTQPQKLQTVGPVDLWHDRAVLHFFTEKEEQAAYFSLLKKLVKPGGFVIIAAFHLTGADKCSGLPVQRYDEHALKQQLGDDFRLVKAFSYTYTMPGGAERPYIYTLFKRKQP